MRIEVDTTGTVAGLQHVLEHLAQDPAVQSVLVLACAENDYQTAPIDALLAAFAKPVFGGLFPAILHNETKLETGVIAVGLPFSPHVHFISGLSDPTADFDALLEERLGDNAPPPTLFVLVDGLSRRINEFIEALYINFGLEINYIGGGAGSLRREDALCLITPQGLRRDGVLLAEFGIRSGIGVSHGWSSVNSTHKVTESEYNIVRSLDWEPAAEIYRRIVAKFRGQVIAEQDLINVVQSHPFGIATWGAERIVRDILRIHEDGSLTCVGEIPQGSFVEVLCGDPDSLIAAAGKAFRLSEENLPPGVIPCCCLFIDCISRVLFLGDAFSKELQAVREPGLPLFGACTIGEIANNGKDFLGFYNKTSVVALLEGA